MKEQIRANLADICDIYANLSFDMDRIDEAEEFFEKSLKTDPEYDVGHFNYGQYRKALKLGINDPRIHYNYALLLRDTNRYNEAEEQYKKALEINPEFYPARNNLVFLLRKMNRYDEAAEYSEK